MMGQFLRQLFTDTPMTVVGLLLFFVSFCGLVTSVYLRKGARQEYEKIGMMPLERE